MIVICRQLQNYSTLTIDYYVLCLSEKQETNYKNSSSQVINVQVVIKLYEFRETLSIQIINIAAAIYLYKTMFSFVQTLCSLFKDWSGIWKRACLTRTYVEINSLLF